MYDVDADDGIIIAFQQVFPEGVQGASTEDQDQVGR